AVAARVGQGVHLGLGALRIKATAEAGEAPVHLAFLEHRSGEEDPRTGSSSGVDQTAIGRDVAELTAEVEHGGNPGGEEELGVPFLGRVDVDVHVDEPGDHELVPAVDPLDFGRHGCRRRRPDRDDPVPFDEDPGVLERGAAGPGEDPRSDAGEAWDFAKGRNMNLPPRLPSPPRILPTGLSTPVHNLRVPLPRRSATPFQCRTEATFPTTRSTDWDSTGFTGA